MKALIGTGVALVTPFNKDYSVDYNALTAIVKYQIENGVNYLVVLGTTGESVTLTKEEKKQVIDCVIKANNNQLPLVLGIGGNDTQAIIEEIKNTNLDTFAAILSVSPMYSKPSQEGIYQHFSAIAKVCPKPIILYNVPGRTSSNILPETVIRLAKEFNNIVAIKEAAGDLVQAMKIIKEAPKDFLVISGDDMIALPTVLAGGAGVISVIGEGFPKLFSTLIAQGLKGNVKEAYKLHYEIAPLIDLIFAEGNPVGIKAVFEALELCNATVRLPLVEATTGLKEKIKAQMLLLK